MTAVMWLLTALRKLPAWAWGVALCVALWLAHTGAVADAYARGKRDAASGVSFDSALVAQTAAAVAIRNAKTDTVWLRTKAASRDVEQAIDALPDTIRTLPPVHTLVQTVRVLLTQVDSLGASITAERAAATEYRKVAEAQLYAQRVIITAQRDTIVALEKRPTKKALAVGVLVGLVAGFFGGRQ